MEETKELEPLLLMKDFRYYAKWWCGLHGSWMLLMGIGHLRGEANVWLLAAFLVVASYGVSLCEAVVFTFLQNVFNQHRWKVLSWIFAVAVGAAVIYLPLLWTRS